MNIAIGKFGGTITFDSNKWKSAIGGNRDAPLLYTLLANRHPNDTFYMIGKSDLRNIKPERKKELNIPKNIIDCFEGFKGNNKKPRLKEHTVYAFNKLKEKNIKLDYGILFLGPVSSASIEHFLTKPSGEYYIPWECFEMYVSNIVYILNKTNIPYCTITTDSRYTPFKEEDLVRRAEFTLSQYNILSHERHIKSETDFTRVYTDVNVTYNNMEKIYFLNRKKHDITKYNKDIDITIILNQGLNKALDRGPLLKEYIKDNNISIYGKWKKEYYEDNRFKGPKPFNELHDILEKTKYTLIIPINKGWVTSKFWEMIDYGIIPFLHPYYDLQHHIKCPEFLRINSPEEFYKKINMLNNNPDKYEILLSHLQDMLLDEYYNGDLLNNELNNAMKKLEKICK